MEQENVGTMIKGGASVVRPEGEAEETPLKYVNPGTQDQPMEGKNLRNEMEEEGVPRDTDTDSSYVPRDTRGKGVVHEETSSLEAYKVLEQRFHVLEKQNLELTQFLKTVIAQQARAPRAQNVPAPDNDTHAKMLWPFRPLVETGIEQRDRPLVYIFILFGRRRHSAGDRCQCHASCLLLFVGVSKDGLISILV
ncbi:hypothetical protein LINPERHAP1_LOCUS20347, partial [Linum perenne]